MNDFTSHVASCEQLTKHQSWYSQYLPEITGIAGLREQIKLILPNCSAYNVREKLTREAELRQLAEMPN